MNYNNTTSHPSNPAIQLQPAVQSYQLQFSPLPSTQQEHTPSTDPLLQQQPYQMQVSPSKQQYTPATDPSIQQQVRVSSVAAYSPAPATLQLQAIAPNQPYVPQQQASPLPQMQVVQIPPTQQLQMQMQPPGSHQSSQQLLAQQQVGTVPVVQTIQQHQQQLQLQQLKQQQMQLKPPSLPIMSLLQGQVEAILFT